MRVTLRKRLTKTGKISLYLDHYPPIILNDYQFELFL